MRSSMRCMLVLVTVSGSEAEWLTVTPSVCVRKQWTCGQRMRKLSVIWLALTAIRCAAADTEFSNRFDKAYVRITDDSPRSLSRSPRNRSPRDRSRSRAARSLSRSRR